MNKWFIKFKNITGTISKKIIIFFLIKNIFLLIFFALIVLWKTTVTFFLFQRSIEGHKWLIPELSCWMTNNECISPFAAYRTYREIWLNSFFCCEAPFPLRSFWSFSLISEFSSPFSFNGRHLYLWK